MKTLPTTVMVFCPNWVGDVVMSTPVFSCIRQNYQDSILIGVIRKYANGVIEDAPWFDYIIDCEDKTVKGFFNLVKAIRNIRPDITLLLTNSFRSALIPWLGRGGKIYGYRRNGRSCLLTGGPIPKQTNGQITPVPMVYYYLEICKELCLTPPKSLIPELFMSSSLKQKGMQILQKYGITKNDMVIGINPGAKFGSSKCWPPEYFARLVEMLDQQWQCKILLFAGPGENEIAKTIVDKSKAPVINTAPDEINLSLLKPLINRCQLLVTNDTGPRHYAVAFDVPVVVIMGPTDPRYTCANLEKTIVIRKHLACSPCHRKICPEGHHNCMRRITPEEVLLACIELMNTVRNP
jgi:heptosyltransferase-2